MADVWANSMACHHRATRRIQCHDPRATCHIAGCCHLVNSLSWFQSHMPHCRVQSPSVNNVMVGRATLQGVIILSAILKIVFRHILFLLFLMQFGLWRASAFVSSSIHLYRYRQVLGVCQDFSASGVQEAQGEEQDLHRIFAFQWDIWKKLWTDFTEILCVEDYWKTRAWICMKCCVSTDVGTYGWSNCLTLSPNPDPDYSPDAGTGLLSPVSFQRCYAEFYVGKIRRIRRPIGRCSEKCF